MSLILTILIVMLYQTSQVKERRQQHLTVKKKKEGKKNHLERKMKRRTYLGVTVNQAMKKSK